MDDIDGVVGPDAADERTISQKYQNKIKEMMSKAD